MAVSDSICAFVGQLGRAFGLYEIIHVDMKLSLSILRYSVVLLILIQNSDGKTKFRDPLHHDRSRTT